MLKHQTDLSMTEISSSLDQNNVQEITCLRPEDVTVNDNVLKQKCRSNKIDDEIQFLHRWSHAANVNISCNISRHQNTDRSETDFGARTLFYLRWCNTFCCFWLQRWKLAVLISSIFCS